MTVYVSWHAQYQDPKAKSSQLSQFLTCAPPTVTGQNVSHIKCVRAAALFIDTVLFNVEHLI